MKMAAKYRIRRWVAVGAIVAFAAWGFQATTPEQCKVPVSEMSQFCKDLLYP